ncbi:MAG: hypothetical protein IKV03_06225 [Alphaproteobacteria bacterium]|nr:hypothetical protein [Alphaproteobacteria bacterium]
MQEYLLISKEELKKYAKNPIPLNWEGAGMQLQESSKKHVTYGFVVETTDEGEYSVGMVSFDKTTEPRWYEKDGAIQQVNEPHWEKSIVMHDEEGKPTFGSYGLTMAGILKVCEEMMDNPTQRVVIRTDETNAGALGLFSKMGLDVYPEYVRSEDKRTQGELIPTSGRVVDTTVEQMYIGIKNYHRPISPALFKKVVRGGR